MNERCADIRERLSAYLDGELDAAAAAEVETHLDGCEGCAAVLADWAAADEALAGARPDRPEAEWEALAARVDAAIEREVADVARATAAESGAEAAEARPEPWWRRVRPRATLGSAATLVVAILIAVLQPWWDPATDVAPDTARPPIDTLGDPGPVLSPAPEKAPGMRSTEVTEEEADAERKSEAEDARKDEGPPSFGADKPEGTLGVTALREDEVPRAPAARGEGAEGGRGAPGAAAEADADEAAADADAYGAAPAPPPTPLREQLRSLGSLSDGEGESAPAPEKRAAGNDAPSWTRGGRPAEVKVVVRPTRRSVREWDATLDRLTERALESDDPEAALDLARTWDAYLVQYPDHGDVLDDRAAAWVRAARLGADGACDEAPSRIDDWAAAADDDGRAAAQALRDELAAICP